VRLFRFFRSLWSRQEGEGEPKGRSNVPKALIELEGVERPPDDLLRRLREIDPHVELLGVGNGIWWLGRVSDNQHRRRIATNILKQTRVVEKNRWVRLNARLALRGFAMVSDWQGEPNSRILLDFQRKDWKVRTGIADLEFEERLLVSDGTTGLQRRLDVLRDKTDSDHRSIFNHVMRGSRSVSGRTA
jgi:hypothetical protein